MREKRKTLDKNFKDLKFEKITRKQKLQEQGITLIALVVTIIILLILAGVTLNIALSDNGLFSKTKKATEDYKEAQSEEEESIRQISTQLYSEYVGAKVTGYSPKNNTVKIEKTTSGVDSETDSYENKLEGVAKDFSQTFTEDDEMNWRVWDYDGNTLRIIGDPTEATLALKGAAGYNNGVWAMDNICRTLYSNEAKGAKATNLKRTDIQKVSTYDYTKYKHDKSDYKEDMTSSDDNGNLIYFGESKTYEASNQYPDMWNDNDKEWTYEYNNKEKTTEGGDKECKIWEVIGTDNGQMNDTMNQGSNSTTFKQSYYYHNYNENEFINDAYYVLIFKKANGERTGEYWLAGRYGLLYENYCDFGLQYVSAGTEISNVSGRSLGNSKGDKRCHGKALRPIVSIDLGSGGYEMTSGIDEDGKMKITLKTAD